MRLFGIYIGYIVVFACILLLIRYMTKVPDYVFRKLLHIVAFTSIIPLAVCTDTWWIAVVVQCIFLVLVVIALLYCERFSFYRSLFVEKGKHEVVISFVMLFGLIAILLAVFWGGFGAQYKYIAVAAIMAWGPGDGAAAIVGHILGRHKLSGKHIEGVKSVEGSVAMAVTSFVCTLATLLLGSGLAWYIAIAFSLVIAVVAALVELYTEKGLDTVTVPLAASVILSLTMLL